MERATRWASLSQNSFVSLEPETEEPSLLPDYDLCGECRLLVLWGSTFGISTLRKFFDKLLVIGWIEEVMLLSSARAETFYLVLLNVKAARDRLERAEIDEDRD